jgi:hypothetical protein
MMVSTADLDAPARLQYWPVGPDLIESARWEDARRFPSLRDALSAAMTEARPAGKAAYLLTQSGLALRPDQVEEIWSRLQGR